MSNIIMERLIEQNKELDERLLEQYNKQVEQLHETLDDFTSEYHDILNHVEVEDWASLAGITIDDMEQMTIREVMELIRSKHGVISSEQLDGIDSIIPAKFIMANNMMINDFTAMQPDLTKRSEMPVPIDRKKDITTVLQFDYKGDNVTIYDKERKFTAYDRSVLNAICSLHEAGNVNFTPSQIYRCMNGLKDGEKVRETTINSIIDSVDKMRFTYARIDCTDEAKQYKGREFKAVIEDFILSAKKVTLINGKDKVVGYNMERKPIFYEYAQYTKQVISVPSKLLNTKDAIRTTPDVIVVREYLIRRIEAMKNPKNNIHNNKILLESLYENIGVINPTKQKAQKIREMVEKLLSKYKKDGYIKNFKFTKEGKAFDGVAITY